jgi:hypothetical protein
MVVLLLALILLALCGGKEIIKFGFGVALMLFGLAVTPHAHAAETSDFYAVTKPIVVCESLTHIVLDANHRFATRRVMS